MGGCYVKFLASKKKPNLISFVMHFRKPFTLLLKHMSERKAKKPFLFYSLLQRVICIQFSANPKNHQNYLILGEWSASPLLGNACTPQNTIH